MTFKIKGIIINILGLFCFCYVMGASGLPLLLLLISFPMYGELIVRLWIYGFIACYLIMFYLNQKKRSSKKLEGL